MIYSSTFRVNHDSRRLMRTKGSTKSFWQLPTTELKLLFGSSLGSKGSLESPSVSKTDQLCFNVAWTDSWANSNWILQL
ncbi:uncharacterized protein VTP21DRAFT_3218 [Calcarisporiella thermophila]|uniref:uncharacterized protein n=1 Tax=Calcarisporiella thermophila TaxID=911321 RepID=UPI003742670D